MILGKADLEKLAGNYAEQAKKAFDNYQETGQNRYYRQYVKHDDLASALTMAAGAADEHEEYVQMKLAVSEFASRAVDLLVDWDDHRIESFLRNVAEYGQRNGLCQKEAEQRNDSR